jgi:predicted MFS family arabinose efflux permease
MQPARFRENHPKIFISVVIALICLTQTYFLALPTYVQMTAADWGFSESQLGFVTAAEVAGGTVGSLLVSFVLARQPMRRLLSFALLAMVIGNGWLIMPQGFEAAMAGRAISGLGYGIIGGATLNYLAVSGSYLSALAVAQGVYTLLLQTLLLPALPSAGIAYGLIAGLAVLCVPAIFVFSRGEVFVSDFAAGKSVCRRGAYLALLSLLMLYAACGVIWTFIGNLGAAAGLDERSITTILGVGPILSLGICWLVPWLIEKGHRFATTITLLLACTVSALWLLLPVTLWSFAIGSFVFFTGWTGAIILIFATVSAYDGAGRHVAMSTAFLGVGYVIGSTVGGVLIETTTVQVAFAVAAAFSLVSTLLYALLRKVPHPEVLDDTSHGTTEDLIGIPEPHFRP